MQYQTKWDGLKITVGMECRASVLKGKTSAHSKKKILTASKEKRCGRKKTKHLIAEAITQEAKTSIPQNLVQFIWSLQVAQRSR